MAVAIVLDVTLFCLIVWALLKGRER